MILHNLRSSFLPGSESRGTRLSFVSSGQAAHHRISLTFYNIWCCLIVRFAVPIFMCSLFLCGVQPTRTDEAADMHLIVLYVYHLIVRESIDDGFRSSRSRNDCIRSWSRWNS